LAYRPFSYLKTGFLSHFLTFRASQIIRNLVFNREKGL
jgi:hypothetical protein